MKPDSKALCYYLFTFLFASVLAFASERKSFEITEQIPTTFLIEDSPKEHFDSEMVRISKAEDETDVELLRAINESFEFSQVLSLEFQLKDAFFESILVATCGIYILYCKFLI